MIKTRAAANIQAIQVENSPYSISSSQIVSQIPQKLDQISLNISQQMNEISLQIVQKGEVISKIFILLIIVNTVTFIFAALCVILTIILQFLSKS